MKRRGAHAFYQHPLGVGRAEGPDIGLRIVRGAWRGVCGPAHTRSERLSLSSGEGSVLGQPRERSVKIFGKILKVWPKIP